MAEHQELILIPGLLCSDALFTEQVSGLEDVANVRIGRVLKQDNLEGMARSILRSAPERFALAGLSLDPGAEVLRNAPRPEDAFRRGFEPPLESDEAGGHGGG